MNSQAERELGRAEQELARGDQSYGKAADAILAAKKADPSLTQEEIGRRLGRSDSWIGQLVRWRTAGSDSPTPFSGKEVAEEVNLRKTKQMLREAPAETIASIVESLPAGRISEIVTAGLDKPGVAREIAKSPKASASITRASGEVWEANKATARAHHSTGGATSNLGILTEVLGNLLVAKRKLRDSYTAAREHNLSGEQIEAVEEELDSIVQIIEWFRSYLSSGDQSFEEELSKLLAQ